MGIQARNGVTPHWLSLPPKGAGVNRMLVRKGMVSEANARGKATRYADRDPDVAILFRTYGDQELTQHMRCVR
jgi:hypothetical protein